MSKKKACLLAAATLFVGFLFRGQFDGMLDEIAKQGSAFSILSWALSATASLLIIGSLFADILEKRKLDNILTTSGIVLVIIAIIVRVIILTTSHS